MTKKQTEKLAQLIDAKYGEWLFSAEREMTFVDQRQTEIADLIMAFAQEHNRAVQTRANMKQRGRKLIRRDTHPFRRIVGNGPK